MKHFPAIRFTAAALLSIMLLMGCESHDNAVTPVSTVGSEASFVSLAKVGRAQIWADCTLFNTVATPASFTPGNGPFDELYNIGPAGGSFMNGVPLISASKPGDQDYNGGRWHVFVLRAGVDPAKYASACSVEDLMLGDFESAGVYFECPLLPMNRRP